MIKWLLSPAMTTSAFFLDFYVYPALAVFCFGVAALDTGWLQAVALAGFGYVSWTLLEYIVHRFALHHLPWFSGLHHVHHASPGVYVGTPTLVSLAIFYAVGYAPAAFVLGRGSAAGWLSGVLLGYLSYVVAHWAVHHVSTRRWRYLRRLKRQHAVHHHLSQEMNFGVTTDLWDRVFGTLAPPSQPRPR